MNATLLIDYLKQEILHDETIDISSSDNLLASGLVDSMGIVRYISWISERWNIEIPPQDMTIEHFITIDAIVAYLESRGAL